MIEDDYNKVLSAVFKNTFINWLKSVYFKKSSEREEASSEADTKGHDFKTKEREEKNEFDKFTKEIFDLKSPEYPNFKTHLSQSKEPIKYFSLFFDIIIRTVIREKGGKEPVLKLDEYYNILSSNFQNSFIKANHSPTYESGTSTEQTIETKSEVSSFTDQSYKRKFSINYKTIDFISESIINKNKLANWVNLEFWSDFYLDKYLDDIQMKFSLRNLILIIKMLKLRKERYEKMEIKIKNKG